MPGAQKRLLSIVKTPLAVDFSKPSEGSIPERISINLFLPGLVCLGGKSMALAPGGVACPARLGNKKPVTCWKQWIYSNVQLFLNKNWQVSCNTLFIWHMFWQAIKCCDFQTLHLSTQGSTPGRKSASYIPSPISMFQSCLSLSEMNNIFKS